MSRASSEVPKTEWNPRKEIPVGHLDALKATLRFKDYPAVPVPATEGYTVDENSGPLPGFNPIAAPAPVVLRSTYGRHLQYVGGEEDSTTTTNTTTTTTPTPSPAEVPAQVVHHNRALPPTPTPTVVSEVPAAPPASEPEVAPIEPTSNSPTKKPPVLASSLKFTRQLPVGLGDASHFADSAKSLLTQEHHRHFSHMETLTVEPNDSLEKILEIFRSVPSFNLQNAVAVRQSGTIHGIIDSRDCLAHLLHVGLPSPLAIFNGANSVLEAFQIPASQLIDKSDLDPIVRIQDQHTVGDLCALFGFGLHRAVSHSNGQDHIITQFDLLNWLVRNRKSFAQFKKKVSELGIIDHPVVTAHIYEPAALALARMYNSKVSAVAILGENEKLVAQLSTSDVMHLNPASFYACYSPVGNFIEQNGAQPIFYMSQSFSLGSVVKRMLVDATPRIWITAHRRVVGVITLSTIFNFLSAEHNLTTNLVAE